MKKIENDKVKSIVWGIIFSVIPIVAFYLMEVYEHNPFVDIRFRAHFFNII